MLALQQWNLLIQLRVKLDVYSLVNYSVDVRQNTMPFLPFKSFEHMTEHLKQDVYVNQHTYAHL